jgi:hypothetical protein
MIVFPHYDLRQMMRTYVDLRSPVAAPAPRAPSPAPTPRATRSSGALLEIEEQHMAIGAMVEAEAESEFEFTFDSSDDDYHQPIPNLPPRSHERKAGSSSINLALLAILDRMRADQKRMAEE